MIFCSEQSIYHYQLQLKSQSPLIYGSKKIIIISANEFPWIHKARETTKVGIDSIVVTTI